MKYYDVKMTKKDSHHYYYKTKNEANQIIQMTFYIFNNDNVTIKWSIELYIGKRNKKSKSFEECISTGKDGIKSLIWSKKCMKDFISFLTNNWSNRNHTIFVYAINSKRMKVYTKGLSSLDFKKGQNFLYKNIINK